MIEYPGTPDRWMTRGGAPAACLGDPTKHGGLPSFEHEDGKLVVYDFLVVFPESDGGYMLLPRWYNSAAVIASEEMVPLHHTPGAWWKWRPCLYRRSLYGRWMMVCSQRELWWRKGLAMMTHALHSDDIEVQLSAILDMDMADQKARKLLAEFLTDYQKSELVLIHKFHVRGAATGNLYAIGLGDGFELVDEVTHEMVASYCLHPEAWMPDADVALATKFALEDEALEVETLENANMTYLGPSQRPTAALRRARDMERELI